MVFEFEPMATGWMAWITPVIYGVLEPGNELI